MVLATTKQLFIPKFSRLVTSLNNSSPRSETIRTWQPHPKTPRITDLAAIEIATAFWEGTYE